MTGSSADSPWGDFWQLRKSASGYPLDSLKRIEAVQRKCWQEFARGLGGRTRVLDLGTGNGTVLATMHQVRPDLELVGIDSAEVLPPSPDGASLQPSVPMEALPFADGSFGAASSQFGYEYGDSGTIARELARVLTPGGNLRLIMHHSQSAVVDYHRGRHEALRWAIWESGALRHTRASIEKHNRVPASTPPKLSEAKAEAGELHSEHAVAAKFIAAIVQTLELGQRHAASKVLSVLDVLEERASSELKRMETLLRAACDSERVQEIRAELEQSGMRASPVETVSEAEGLPPFAWLLDATLL